MNPITDAEVAELPLDRGRTRLMEAIRSTPSLEPVRTGPPPVKPRRSGLGIAVAAAAVAAIVAVPLWLDGQGGQIEPGPATGDAEVASGGPSAGRTSGTDGGLFPVVEDVPTDWRFESISGQPVVSVSYLKQVEFQGRLGGMTFAVEVRDASDYDAIAREETTQGGVRAGTIDVDGRTARVWRLTEKPGAGTGECTSGCVHHWSAITPVENGQYALVMGAGLGPDTLAEPEWRRLVAGVRLTGRAEFEETLPDDTVVPTEEQLVVEELARGVPAPDGFDVSAVRVPDYSSRSGVAFAIGFEMTCAWVRAGEEPEPATWPLFAELGELEQSALNTLAGERREALRTCP